MHLARRMAGRKVEFGEVVVVALDVRPFGDREAHVGENRGQFVIHLADRVDAAGLDAIAAHRQAEVERFALQPRIERLRLQFHATAGERRGRFVLQRVDRRASATALVGRHFAKRGEQRRDRSLLAERGDARRLERRFVVRRGDGGEGLLTQGREIGHGGPVERVGAAKILLPQAGEGGAQRRMRGFRRRVEAVLPSP